MHTRALRWVFVVFLLGAMLAPAYAANETFVVQNIEVHGLQRISTGTVFTYLPIGVGDKVDAARIGNSIKALYQTGFFSDIQMRRAGDTLIIDVKERPSIASFSIVGNKKVKTEDLNKSMKQAGLQRGRIFSRSVLNDVKQALTNLYYGHAKYNAKIDMDVEHIGNNRVDVTVNISEGVDTTIKSINIVGNEHFDDDKLLDQFKLEPTQWLALFQSSDKYVRETLSGDLESLRSFYMDRGYADFHIESVQVTLSPDYKHIFITINVHEGQIYTIHDVDLAGEFVVPKGILEKLILPRSGDTFSMGMAQNSADLMSNLLGSKGYAFAKISPVPKLNHDTHEVDLTFYVQPGNRAYVRRINFSGMPGTDNIVFRREMRQLEGTWLSNTALKRSKIRLQRLRFVKKVDESTDRIPGSPDLVDLNYELTARQAGKFMVGVGYSPYFGVGLNASVEHNNFLGEGDTIVLDLHGSQINKVYNIAWTDPYATINGVSRTIRAYYRENSALLLDASPLDRQSYGLMLSYGIPLSEFSRFQLGGSASHNELITNVFSSSKQYIQFANNPENGSVYATPLGPAIRYQQYTLLTGWMHDTRNRAMFATRGNRQQVSLRLAMPFSDVKYYQLTLNSTDFVPIGAGFLYLFNGTVGVNKSYGGSSAVPPTQHFFVGGPRSVRGFKSGYLGPLDSNGYPAGGNFQLYVQNELIIPPLFGVGGAGSASSRFSVFLDFGSAFPDPGDFRFGDLYKSAGLAAQFVTPMGLMHVSLGWPLGDAPSYMRETFQFTVGRRF